jgi:probable rRNA maturation factor
MSDPAHSSSVLFRGGPGGIRRKPFKEFAERLRNELAHGRPFECLITDDRAITTLNGRFRRKWSPTDVLSFPVADGMPDGYLGEVAISWQRAAEQAAERGHSTEQEIEILMLHGVLHLLGYDHQSDRGRMARLETAWRRRLGLPDGLIERSRQ